MRLRRLCSLAALAGAMPAASNAQHVGHGDPLADTLRASPLRGPGSGAIAAHALPLVTHASPTAARRTLTEAYASQVAVMAAGAAARGRLEGMVMLNLEGVTLQRGELTTGTYGEGYVDRRHPHAYVHEAVVSVRTKRRGVQQASLSAGRGFATFGSDDPMVRPFVKYPVNHHLAQILERAIIAGAVRTGIVGLEVSLFNGDEPTRASDLPMWSRLGDSWATRVTLYPRDGLEVSVSRGFVASPEVRAGFGVDADKWHAGARLVRGSVYALAEWARSTNEDDGREGRAYDSFLAEAAVMRRSTTFALRVESTDRHEEVRLEDPFHVAPSTGEGHVLAVTRWRTMTVAASRHLHRWKGVSAAPFLEVALIHPTLQSGLVFDPVEFYGARTLTMLSAGMRLTAGTWHTRMGRYGAAVTTSHQHGQ